MAKGKYEYWLTDDRLLLLAAWARDGLTDEQIAKKAGVSTSTLYKWKGDHPEISEALKKGKEIVDICVENTLLSKALGGTYVDQVAIKLKHTEYNEETGRKISEREFVEVVDLNKGYPPDVAAIVFWLKNRKQKVWRDKPEGDTDDAIAAIKALVESNKEVARLVQP